MAEEPPPFFYLRLCQLEEMMTEGEKPGFLPRFYTFLFF